MAYSNVFAAFLEDLPMGILTMAYILITGKLDTVVILSMAQSFFMVRPPRSAKGTVRLLCVQLGLKFSKLLPLKSLFSEEGIMHSHAHMRTHTRA